MEGNTRCRKAHTGDLSRPARYVAKTSQPMTARYLVDTDWAIHYLHGNQDIIHTLRRIAPDGIALSVISLAELCEGVYYSRTPEDNERALGEFLTGIELLPVNQEIAKRFGRERGRLRAAK